MSTDYSEMEKERGISRREFLGLVAFSGAAGACEPVIEYLDTERVRRPEVITGHEPELTDKIIITIDDCYDYQIEKEMFDLLRSKGLKAVVFPNTIHINTLEEKELFRAIYKFGFDIGYHTTRHQKNITFSELEEDERLFRGQMRRILDDNWYQIEYVRAPYANWSDQWMTWSERNGYTSVKWNNVPVPSRLGGYWHSEIQYNLSPGIILLHTRLEDTEWLRGNIDRLVQMSESYDFSIVTLSDVYR